MTVPARHEKTLLRRMWDNRMAYLFISPFYIMFVAFMLIPIVLSLYLSLTDLRGMGKMNFIGLANYKALLEDPVYLTAVKNTLVFTVIQVPIMVCLALILALMLNSKNLKLRNFFRSIVFLPSVMSLAVAALAFSMILNRDIGLLNILLRALGLPVRDWLNDPRLAFWSIMGVVTWRWTGYNAVILLSGLQNIDDELYEAARIDGANLFQQFRYITVPLLWPIIFFCIMLGTIGVFQLFEEPMILTKGGPVNSTLSIAMYQYNQAFGRFRFGYGSAVAYSLVIMLTILSFINSKLFSRDNALS